MVSKETFSQFMANHGNHYPYNDVPQTRTSLRPTYLLMKTPVSHVLFDRSGLHLLPTSCMPNNAVQEIILCEKGLPLPGDYSDIADCLECWGREKNYEWVQDALLMFFGLLHEQIKLSRQSLFYETLCLLLQRMWCHVFEDSDKMADALQHWHSHFLQHYSRESGDFFKIACKTIRFADMVIQLERHPNEFNVADYVAGHLEHLTVEDACPNLDSCPSL